MTIRRGKTGSRSLNAELAGGPILPTYTVAQLTGAMAAAKNVGRLIRVSNGAAGSPCLAMADATSWKVVGGALSTAVAAA